MPPRGLLLLMASVFLSYDHEDEGRAAPIAAALEGQGHSVWWDRQLHGGAEYNSEIETAVEQADAVVVLWSARSVRSAWVRDEAGEGRDRGRLVPVLIEPVKPPMGFRQYQSLDLSAWAGGKRIPRLGDLLHAIDRAAGTSKSQARPALSKAVPEKAVPKGLAVSPSSGMPRRMFIGAGAAAALGVVGGGIWWATREPEDPRFRSIMQQAGDGVRHWNADAKLERLLEEAVTIRPTSAKAWGYLALVRSIDAQASDPMQTAQIVDKAQRAAEQALSIDPKEPNALLAMFELQGSTLDWFTRDQKLRQIIAIDPNNVGAIAELVLLTQATGMCLESWTWNERAIALDPLNPDYLSKRALKLWILGRPSEADKVIDQVRALYPSAAWAWWIRFYLYAATGRIAAAHAMLNGNPGLNGRLALARMWRASLAALEHPSPASIAAAQAACLNGSKQSREVASQAVPVLSMLGDLDDAFAIANGLLLSRGPVVQKEQGGTRDAAEDAGWRISTQWMFTPSTSAMRADPRFQALCEGVGLTEYWRRRRVKPDYQRA